MNLNRLIFRVAAARQMFQGRIGDSEVRYVLVTGKIIEDYPAEQPYPIRLVAGTPRGRGPLHVVIAENRDTQEHIILTIYEPKLGS